MSELLTPVQAYTDSLRPQRGPSAYTLRRPGGPVPEAEVMALVRRRRQAAKADRAKYEPDWALALSFLEGKQWVGVTRRYRRIIDIRDDPREKEREHHTENVITSYFYTALGQLLDDDLMPALLFRKDQWQQEKYAKEANLAYRYAFDEELDGDEVLGETFMAAVGLGTAFVRCRLVRGRGQSYGTYPVHPDTGQLVVGQPGRDLVAQAQQNGQTLRFGELKGELEWEPLLPHNVLVPPGVYRWRKMPWFFVEVAIPVDQLRAEFPNRANDIQPQSLEVTDVAGLRGLPTTDGTASGGSGALEDHCLYSIMYEQPTQQFPKGRLVHFTGEVLLEEDPKFPLEIGGQPHHGVVPFRFRSVPKRWWGRGLPDDAIPVQVQRNRTRSQHIEWKDRNLGRVYAFKGTITETNQPTGRIRELIEVLPGMQFPQETQPGQLPPVLDEIQMLNEAMDYVTGISKVSALSSAPANVAAYAAFAFFKQQDEQRNKPTRVELYRGIRELTKVTLCGIKLYWPEEKVIAINNVDGTGDLETFTFLKSNLPPEVYVQVGKGQGHPMDPAAQVQLCFDIFTNAISSGQPLPISWLLESLKAGKPLPLPDDAKDVQRDKAEYENLLMAQLGTVPPVAPYDDDQVHIPLHRMEETTHSLDPSPEGQMIVQRIEQHLKLHEMNMQQKAAQQAANSVPSAQGQVGAALGGAPEQGPPPPAAGPPGLPAGAMPQVPAAAQALLSRLGGQ